MTWDSDNLNAPHTIRELDQAEPPRASWADRCRDCARPIGQQHLSWCPEAPGTVERADTAGVR